MFYYCLFLKREMKKTAPDKLLIGAHTSAQGGAHNALLEGQAIGATTIQFFTANQKTWRGKEIGEKEIAHKAIR